MGGYRIHVHTGARACAQEVGDCRRCVTEKIAPLSSAFSFDRLRLHLDNSSHKVLSLPTNIIDSVITNQKIPPRQRALVSFGRSKKKCTCLPRPLKTEPLRGSKHKPPVYKCLTFALGHIVHEIEPMLFQLVYIH
jgi:hypothetical protein